MRSERLALCCGGLYVQFLGLDCQLKMERLVKWWVAQAVSSTVGAACPARRG